jgi:hypothetical protein
VGGVHGDESGLLHVALKEFNMFYFSLLQVLEFKE